jgi:hypothetical protein
MAGRPVAAAGAPTPPHCSPLQMCGRSSRSFGSSFLSRCVVVAVSLLVTVAVSPVILGRSLASIMCLKCSSYVRKQRRRLVGYSTRPILYKSSRRCGRIPIRVQAQDSRAVAVGRESRCTSSLQDFRPVIMLPRDVASPSPCAYFPHFYRALLIFTLPFLLGVITLTLASASRTHAMLRSSGSVQCATKRRERCEGSGDTAAPACAPVGCCLLRFSRPVLFSWQRTVYPFLGGDSPPSRRCLNHPVAYREPDAAFPSRFASSEGRVHGFFFVMLP